MTGQRTPGRDSPVGVIGAGRLGSSLAVAMHRCGYRIAAASSRRAEQRAWLGQQIDGIYMAPAAQEVADRCRIVFITSSDAAINEIATELRWRQDQAVVHCSGAAPVSELQPAAGAGAMIGGFHPMQTFPSREASGSFNGITFGLETQAAALDAWLRQLASDLGSKCVSITEAHRAAYHSAAVMACGLLAGLTGLAAEMWASTGISRDEALKGLGPLVQSTAAWMAEKGIPAAMTGPYVRGDIATIGKHLDATAGHSPEHGAAYAAVALASLHVAKEQGGLSDAAEMRIREMLVSSLKRSCEIID